MRKGILTEQNRMPHLSGSAAMLNVPRVMSVAFSSLLGLSLKNGFDDYYYSAIPDYFYPCYPLSDHSKILSKSVDDDCPELSVVARSCHFLEKGDRR
jgi:hypothetical protein